MAPLRAPPVLLAFACLWLQGSVQVALAGRKEEGESFELALHAEDQELGEPGGQEGEEVAAPPAPKRKGKKKAKATAEAAPGAAPEGQPMAEEPSQEEATQATQAAEADSEREAQASDDEAKSDLEAASEQESQESQKEEVPQDESRKEADSEHDTDSEGEARMEEAAQEENREEASEKDTPDEQENSEKDTPGEQENGDKAGADVAALSQELEAARQSADEAKAEAEAARQAAAEEQEQRQRLEQELAEAKAEAARQGEAAQQADAARQAEVAAREAAAKESEKLTEELKKKEEIERRTMKPMKGMFTASKFEYDPLTRYADGKVITDDMRVIDVLKEAVKKSGDKLAFMQPLQNESGGLIPSGQKQGIMPWSSHVHQYKYKTWTWKEYHDDVMRVAKAFLGMGLQPMDAVNIRGANSPEWLITFMGCIAAGGLPVGLYPTDSDDILEFKAQDSGAKFIVVGKSKDLSIYSKFLHNLPSVKAVVLWDLNPDHPDKVDDVLVERLRSNDRLFLRWGEFLKKVTFDSADFALKQAIDEQRPGQAATVVYTSGTTGNPKGVMLSQDAVTWTCRTIIDAVMDKKSLPSDGHMRILSYLPLNHVAGQMLDILAPLHLSATQNIYATVFFPAQCYFKKECHLQQLGDAQPTLFLGVPLVWEGMKEKIQHDINAIEEKGREYAGWALKDYQIGWVVNQGVKSKILSKIGFQELKFAISGAGAISASTLDFFHGFNLNILNAYAQSESSCLGAAWRNSDFKEFNMTAKLGSIGRAVGNKLELAPNPDPNRKDGEIMLWGRNVMLGYLNAENKTRETITEDGWLKTGDVATIDRDGFLFLTGRAKEIMKDIGGEMIAPNAVEEGVKDACGTIIKAVIAVGDGKYYLSVLVTLNEAPETDKEGKLKPSGNLAGAAKHVDAEVQTVKAATESVKWEKALQSCITAYNGKAAKKAQKVWRYAILPEDIIADHSPDLMTTTFKIKREGVEKRYAGVIATCGGDAKLPKESVEKCGAR